MSDPGFSAVRAVRAEGARVGFASCLLCGAAILLDPASERNRLDQHAAWHDAEEQSDG